MLSAVPHSSQPGFLLMVSLPTGVDIGALLGHAMPHFTAAGAHSVRVDMGHSPGGDAGATPRTAPRAKALSLSLTGRVMKKRVEVLLDKTPVLLTPSSFQILLALVAARQDGGAAWVHKSDLGGRTEQGWQGISRLRSELCAHVPFGVELLENDGSGMYRLGTKIHVAHVDTDAIAKMDNAKVRALAAVIARRG